MARNKNCAAFKEFLEYKVYILDKFLDKFGKSYDNVETLRDRWFHEYAYTADREEFLIQTSKLYLRIFPKTRDLKFLNALTNHMADYLSHVKNNRLLQAGLPKDAILLHKTGDIGFMLGDAGIVKTHTNKKYIVAILVKRPYNSQQGKNFIVKASKIIYNNIHQILHIPQNFDNILNSFEHFH